MFKLSDTMILALLKKGYTQEGENVKMEFEVPLEAFGFDAEDVKGKAMKMNFEVGKYSMTITQD